MSEYIVYVISLYASFFIAAVVLNATNLSERINWKTLFFMGMCFVGLFAITNPVRVELKISEMCVLEINSIGDDESRGNYVATLVKFLQTHEAKLSADSKVRLKVNPLRILDSKDEGEEFYDDLSFGRRLLERDKCVSKYTLEEA